MSRYYLGPRYDMIISFDAKQNGVPIECINIIVLPQDKILSLLPLDICRIGYILTYVAGQVQDRAPTPKGHLSCNICPSYP